MKRFSRLSFLLISVGLLDRAYAAEVTDTTPCSAMAAAMDSENPMSIRPFTVYVLNAMDDFDTKHIQTGEPGIMAQMSDDGRYHLAATISVNCRDHPKMTVYNSAGLVYRGVREMELQFGTAK